MDNMKNYRSIITFHSIVLTFICVHKGAHHEIQNGHKQNHQKYQLEADHPFDSCHIDAWRQSMPLVSSNNNLANQHSVIKGRQCMHFTQEKHYDSYGNASGHPDIVFLVEEGRDRLSETHHIQ